MGEQTEQESSEQLLTELADADRLHDLFGGGDRGLLGLDDRVADIGGERRPTGERPTGDRRETGDRRLLTGDERRGGGERGDLRPTGDRRAGGDRGERGDRRPVCERDRLRRLGEGDDEPSMYNDL